MDRDEKDMTYWERFCVPEGQEPLPLTEAVIQKLVQFAFVDKPATEDLPGEGRESRN